MIKKATNLHKTIDQYYQPNNHNMCKNMQIFFKEKRLWEEILKKMEDIAALKDRKEKIQEKQKEFENSKAEIEKMYKESNLILTASPLKI